MKHHYVPACYLRAFVDLKPGNVMLKPDGTVKVLDFGLAKFDAAASPATVSSTMDTATGTARTVAGTVLGTAAYMSPEQARGLPVDRRGDVWSFGCVLFECLAGRPPFDGATAADLLARILQGEPDWTLLPVGAPAAVRDTLRRCLRKDAAGRPRDIRDVRLELDGALAAGAKGERVPGKSIAVLPFDNLSAPDDEYFADGMTEEILNALAQLDGVRVAARTSCFAFKGRREDLRLVGEKLDVATVLEGSVRRSGQRLRITAQLVNVTDGCQMWSERYDREMTDVFEVQDEIAGAIASRLLVTMRGNADRARVTRGTRNVEAYDLYDRGRALLYRRGGSVIGAIRCFEQAIALDPGYADVLAALADRFRLQGTYGAAPTFEVMPRARGCRAGARDRARPPRGAVHAC